MQKLKFMIIGSLLFALSGFNSAKAITADELLVAVQGFAEQVIAAFGQVVTLISDLQVDVADLESRVSDLEVQSPNFGGYGTPFSPDGAPKNVVVLARDDQFGGGTSYWVRSRYATSTEQISIDGVLTQRPYIANYAFASVDELGNLTFVSNYIEAPDTENYINFHIESSTYDPNTLQKTIDEENGDTLFESWPCAGDQVLICQITQTLNATGEITDHYTWSYARALIGAQTVNGMTFDDVRVEDYINVGQGQSRLRAKGIGVILRMDDGGDQKVVYYRVDGQTGGSLAGTPFDSGAPLQNLFF